MTFQNIGLIRGLSRGLENVTFKHQDFPGSVRTLSIPSARLNNPARAMAINHIDKLPLS